MRRIILCHFMNSDDEQNENVNENENDEIAI